jgi:acetyl-CoA carboxylase biotin carboxyl carrier protein
LPDSLSSNELDEIRQLLKIHVDNGLTELNVKQPNGVSVTVRTVADTPTAVPVSYAAVVPQPTLQDAAPAEAPKAPPATGRNPKAVALESPMVGSFYRSQSPADPPFVKEGDIITIGQSIGLIEAMKVYSEIPAEHAGRVIEFAAVNGQLVQLGQPLMYVEPI